MNNPLDPCFVPTSMKIDQDMLGQQNLMDFDWPEEDNPEIDLNNPSTSRRTHTRAANNMQDYTEQEMNAKAEHQRGTPALPIEPRN
jgi:hypothetical protein